MSRVDEIRARLEAARKVVSGLCTPRGTAGHIDWVMSIPARPDTDPDLVISATLTDTRDLLGRVEKLEEAMDALLAAIPKQTGDCDWWQDDLTHAVAEARTLLADESKENEHGNK